MTKSQLQEITKKADDFRSVNISIYKSKNIGKEDVADASFSSPLSDAIGFGSISYPNENPKSVDISFDGKVVSTKYHLLPSTTEHVFWVASYAPGLDMNFSSDVKGVHVLSSSEKWDQENPFPWWLLGTIALLSVTFAIGVGVGASWVTGELKKRGVDADFIMKESATLPPSLPTP